jgi:glycopeptide antibiotics resistance protein
MSSLRPMRPVIAVFLAAWLLGGLLFTLQAAHPLPGQVVDDNLVPLRTIRIYLANLDDPFWVGQLLGNLSLLLPLGLFGPFVLPALDRWWRIGLVALVYSSAIEIAQLRIADRSADVDDVLVNVLGALIGFAMWRLVRSIGARS